MASLIRSCLAFCRGGIWRLVINARRRDCLYRNTYAKYYIYVDLAIFLIFFVLVSLGIGLTPSNQPGVVIPIMSLSILIACIVLCQEFRQMLSEPKAYFLSVNIVQSVCGAHVLLTYLNITSFPPFKRTRSITTLTYAPLFYRSPLVHMC